MMPQLHLRHATEGVAVNAAPAADAVYALPMKLDHTGQICGEAEVIVDEEARRLAAAIEHAHANDALQALVTLDLSLNKIGDDGLRHLGDAVSHGAAPALKTLLLSGNAASDAARQAVEDALKLRS